jgi:hypothetical protein
MELALILVVKIQDPVERFISLKATAKFVVQIPVAVGILHVFLLAKCSQKVKFKKFKNEVVILEGFHCQK